MKSVTASCAAVDLTMSFPLKAVVSYAYSAHCMYFRDLSLKHIFDAFEDYLLCFPTTRLGLKTISPPFPSSDYFVGTRACPSMRMRARVKKCRSPVFIFTWSLILHRLR
jgi:hypothetical protein